MCNDCFSKSIKCPRCKPLSQAQRDGGARQLHIYCTNRDRRSHVYEISYPVNPNDLTVVQKLPEEIPGCQWRGEIIDDLQSHLDSHCPHGKAKCRYSCGIDIIRCQKDFHESRACHKRPFKCWFCGLEAAAEDIDSHASKCDKRPTSTNCPNGCKAVVVQDELAYHLEQCPLQELSCEFERVGCRETVSRKDYDAHINDDALKHLALLAQSFAAQHDRQEEAAHEQIAQKVSEEVMHKTNELIVGMQSSMNQQVADIRREASEQTKEVLQQIADAKKQLEKTTQKARFLAQLQLEAIDIAVPSKTMISTPFFIMGYCVSVKVNREQTTLHLVLQPGRYDDSLIWPVEGEVVLVLLHPKDSGKNRELKYFVNKTQRPQESCCVEFRHVVSYISNLPVYMQHNRYRLAVKSAQL